MAINNGTLADGDGDFSDWIEVQNRGDMSIDLAGAHLTDDPDDPSRWPFPSVTLGPGDYLRIRHPAVFDELHCGESLLHTYSRIWPSAPVPPTTS